MWDTSSTRTARRPPKIPRWVILAGALLVLAVMVWGISELATAGNRDPGEVVEEFREAQLEVGRSYPLDEDPLWDLAPRDLEYEAAVRFEVPSMGPKVGGRVFSFSNKADLIEMRRYFEGLGGVISGTPVPKAHLYEDDLLLLQMSNDMTKGQADRYGEVFKQ